jgi:hypothetical protein
MQWTRNETDNLVSFELNHGGQIISRLTFDKYKSYQEANCLIDGKEYILKPGDFWNSHTLLTDKEGKEVATLTNEKDNNRKWVLNIGDKKFFIHYHTHPLFELVIYDDAYLFLLTCKVTTHHHEKQIDLAFHEAIEKLEEKDILATIGWYLFIPVAQENMLSYAV